MKVSVIIPCYNFEDYIEQSILSVVAQKTNFEFEILVRDDFSTDKSQLNIERVANFNTNVRFFNPEENWGGDKNIKFLIEQAKGEYIAYLDGDDYWTDFFKLQKQIENKGLNLHVSKYQQTLISIDQDNFERAVSNILQNAIKYTQSGSISVYIKEENTKVII